MVHMTKIAVLLVFGGQSPAHEVSLASAHNAYAALDEDKYDVSLCYITKKGEWRLVDSIDERISYQVLMPHLGEKQFETADGTVIDPDVLLPILHGSHGEDGDVQGLAQLMGLPCVGPSLAGAAITMDQDVTKRLLRDAGIPVADWLTWQTNDPQPMYDNVVAKLGKTVIVKPVGLRSFDGVNTVRNTTEFLHAMKLAAEYDRHVMIEQVIEGKKIEVAVLGNEHPVLAQQDDGLGGLVIERVNQHAQKAYRATCGHGMAKISFIVTPEDKVFLSEISTIPEFTTISAYPKLWRAEGLTYPALLDRLVALALE